MISMIETPSLLSPCGSYQVDFFPIKDQSDYFLRVGTFEGKTEFRELVTEVEMFREIEGKRFRKFRTVKLNKIPQIYEK